MKFVSLLVALVLIVVAEVRCENRCEQCIPHNNVEPLCVLVDNQKLTFANKMAVDCNILCGQKAEILFDGPCYKDYFDETVLAGFTCQTCQVPLNNWQQKPVCASVNGKLETYATARHAYCNGFCGLILALAKVRCENENVLKTVSLSCKDCVPNDEVQPVCGNIDGKNRTYINFMALHCKSVCSPGTEFLYYGPCENEPWNLEVVRAFSCVTCMIPSETNPVCVLSNGKKVTYPNNRHVYCERLCSPEEELNFIHYGEC